MKISACMIVKNEEKHIRKCVDTYKDIVHEIIVVDTGSEDNTVEIAKELGAKVYFYKWNNSFCKAKNFALDKAKGDWIIFLDADEYFDKDKVKSLNKILSGIHGKKEVDALLCKLINIDEDSGLIQDVNPTVRIFRNSPRIRYKNDIHEEVYKVNGSFKSYILEDNQLVVYHTGYSPKVIRDKVLRNIKLLKESMLKTNEQIAYYYLCDSYFCLGEFKECIRYGNDFLNSGFRLTDFCSKVYKNILESMIALKYSYKDIRKVILDAMKTYKNHPMFYFYSGIVDFAEEKYTSAYTNFELTLKYQRTISSTQMNVVPSVMYLIFMDMGKICELKNNEADAMEYYVKSLKENKFFSEAFVKLIQLVKNENCEDIIYLLNSIYDKDRKKDLEFLVGELSKLKSAKILGYYWNIWNKKFDKKDSLSMYVLLSNKYYDKAFEMFFNSYLNLWTYWAALNSVVSALSSTKTDNADYLVDFVKPSFRRIIKSYKGISDAYLISEDFNDFANILKELLLLSDKNNIEMFLELKKNFKDNVFHLIGDVLFEASRYDLAVKYYDDSKTNHTLTKEVRIKIYLRSGISYYKLKEYANSLEKFENALNLGCKENSTVEFIQWIYQQCNNEELMNKAAALKANCSWGETNE